VGLLKSSRLGSLGQLVLTDWGRGYMEDERKALKKRFGTKLKLV
jgi:hypothetical protein